MRFRRSYIYPPRGSVLRYLARSAKHYPVLYLSFLYPLISFHNLLRTFHILFYPRLRHEMKATAGLPIGRGETISAQGIKCPSPNPLVIKTSSKSRLRYRSSQYLHQTYFFPVHPAMLRLFMPPNCTCAFTCPPGLPRWVS